MRRVIVGMRFSVGLSVRDRWWNLAFRRAQYIALILAVAGGLSLTVGPYLPSPNEPAFASEAVGGAPAVDLNGVAVHICIVHAACFAGDVRAASFAVVYWAFNTLELPLDAEPARDRMTLPLERPPISAATT